MAMTISEYMTGLEKSVNSLLTENEQLKRQLAEHQPDSPTVEKLIRLLAELDPIWSTRWDTLPRGEVRLIELYREITKEREEKDAKQD